MEVEFTARQVKISKACARRLRRDGTHCPDFGQNGAPSITFGAEHVQIVELTCRRVRRRSRRPQGDTLEAALREAMEHAETRRAGTGQASRGQALPKGEKVLTAPLCPAKARAALVIAEPGWMPASARAKPARRSPSIRFPTAPRWSSAHPQEREAIVLRP